MKILALFPFEDEGKIRLQQTTPDSEIFYEANEKTVSEADIIIGNLPIKYLSCVNNMKNLKWKQLSMAGTEPYSLKGTLPDDVILTNVTGAFGLAISEHMVGCVMMLYKKLHLYRDNQQKSVWLDRGNVKSVRGATVLSVGMGDIGSNFTERMKALGAYTIGIRRTDMRKPDYVDEVYTSEALDDILPRADIVALSMPNTPETKGMFSRERITRMKNEAVLLNVGRGNAIDTEALCDALDSGKLYGAAVDVTDPEPLPADHRLWKCENAIVTPHISGFFHLRETYDNIVNISIENLRRYVSGEELMNVIDKSTGYRMLI